MPTNKQSNEAIAMHKYTSFLIIPALLFAGPLLAAAHSGQPVSKIADIPARQGDWSEAEVARGREQLIRAFDAAWIRVIASGKDREIVMSEPRNQPGAAQGYVIKLVDCLPTPEVALWPENPVGPFKDILETGKIRQLVQAVPDTPENSTYYFSGISQKYQDAVIAEISKHYDVDLQVENVVVAPGRLPSTYLLVDNKIDFISQVNATGGVTQEMRRRVSRRFTCTMSASSQYIHIPEDSKLVDEIKSLNDLIARPDIKICAGVLTTQMAQAFMPEHTVQTKYLNDLPACDREIKRGKLDVFINPLNDLSIAGLDGYVAVATPLVAGTPLWVAKEGIECPSDGDPKTEDACFETSAP
jgi:hypothetical protein